MDLLKHSYYLKKINFTWIVESKCSKLKALKDEMKLVEMRLKNEQQKCIKNEENTVTTFEYAKMHTKVSHLQSQVVALTNQLRQAKQTSINAHLVDHVNCRAVRYYIHIT